MKFGFIGINYKKANLNIRDKTSFTDLKKVDFFSFLPNIDVDQCMILSTCNRSEVYFFYKEDSQFEKMLCLYKNSFKEVCLDDYLIYLKGNEAVKYLFRIAAGLESLVLGEDQILGQVKDAMDFSRAMGYSKKELNKVVRDAVTCAKEIKTKLKISEKPISVSYIGIKNLYELNGIKDKNILVIGSGKTAALALKYLFEYGAKKVFLCNRTIAHGKKLKEEFKSLNIVDYEERYNILELCDSVVSATLSPHCVIKKENLLSKKPIAYLDLAAPRDIDENIADIPGVKLINLDTLQKISDKNQIERQKLVEESKEIINEYVDETNNWLLISRMDKTIESLQQKCSEIVDDSFVYLNNKIELSKREQKILKKVLNASVQRIVKEPISELKSLDTREKQDEYKALVNKLFKIE